MFLPCHLPLLSSCPKLFLFNSPTIPYLPLSVPLLPLSLSYSQLHYRSIHSFKNSFLRSFLFSIHSFLHSIFLSFFISLFLLDSVHCQPHQPSSRACVFMSHTASTMYLVITHAQHLNVRREARRSSVLSILTVKSLRSIRYLFPPTHTTVTTTTSTIHTHANAHKRIHTRTIINSLIHSLIDTIFHSK